MARTDIKLRPNALVRTRTDIKLWRIGLVRSLIQRLIQEQILIYMLIILSFGHFFVRTFEILKSSLIAAVYKSLLVYIFSLE